MGGIGLAELNSIAVRIVGYTLDIQAGVGRRPALVLSDRGYNAKSGRALVVPITSRVRGWSFEVALPADAPVQGVALVDQAHMVD